MRRCRRPLVSALAAILLAGVAIGQQATLVGTLDGHTEPVYSVAWSPDGKTLATAGFDNTIRLWDASTRKELRNYEGHTKIVMAVAISPGGTQILSGGNDNTGSSGTIRPPEAAAKKRSKEKAKAKIGSARPGQDVHRTHRRDLQRRLESRRQAGGHRRRRQDGPDLGPGQRLAGPVVDRPRHDRLRGGLQPQGRSSSPPSGDDKLIKYWNVADGKELRKSQGHGAPVYSIAFQPRRQPPRVRIGRQDDPDLERRRRQGTAQARRPPR